MAVIENPPSWSAKQAVHNAAGAQTERRGGAGLVRGLLGGKDLTGRLFATSDFRLQILDFPEISNLQS